MHKLKGLQPSPFLDLFSQPEMAPGSSCLPTGKPACTNGQFLCFTKVAPLSGQERFMVGKAEAFSSWVPWSQSYLGACIPGNWVSCTSRPKMEVYIWPKILVAAMCLPQVLCNVWLGPENWLVQDRRRSITRSFRCCKKVYARPQFGLRPLYMGRK